MINVDNLLHINRDINEFKVYRKVFVDDNILALENRKIFQKCWLYVAHKSEISNPGDFITREIAEKNLLITNNKEGEIRAFYNVCPHRGSLVCRENEGNSKVFQCFYHAWTFNNDGKLVGLPESSDGYCKDQFNLDGSRNLQPVENFAQYRGLYFVNFDHNPIPLEEYLADAKEYIDLVMDQSSKGMEIVEGTHEYSMRANWKLLVENSADGYHAQPTHKTYFDYLKTMNGKHYKPPTPIKELNIAKDLGNGHFVTEKSGVFKWGRPVARWIPAWGEQGQKLIVEKKKELIDRLGFEQGTRIAENDFNMVIFPNLVINNIMAITIRTFYPKSPDYMKVNQWSIAPKDEDQSMREIRLKNFLEFLGPGGFATPDDNEALELCQKGFHTLPETWNDLSKGMNKESSGITPKNSDEFHMRVFWQKWHEYISEN